MSVTRLCSQDPLMWALLTSTTPLKTLGSQSLRPSHWGPSVRPTLSSASVHRRPTVTALWPITGQHPSCGPIRGQVTPCSTASTPASPAPTWIAPDICRTVNLDRFTDYNNDLLELYQIANCPNLLDFSEDSLSNVNILWCGGSECKFSFADPNDCFHL